MSIWTCKLRHLYTPIQTWTHLPRFFFQDMKSTLRKFWFDHNMPTTAMILSKIFTSLWFDHNMATTLDLPLPLNILEDSCSEHLKTSTLFRLKKILQLWQHIFEKLYWRLWKDDFYTSKNWTWALLFQKTSTSASILETSDFPSNIWKLKKMEVSWIRFISFGQHSATSNLRWL